MTETVQKPNAEKLTIPELRERVRLAKAREQDLAREADALPEKIREVSRALVKQKAEAARAGDTLLVVADESEVNELRERQDTLTYERWAAALHRAEAERELGIAEEQSYRELIEPRRTALAEAEAAAERAQDALQQARGAYNGAFRQADAARKRMKDAMEEIQHLEANYPGGDA